MDLVAAGLLADEQEAFADLDLGAVAAAHLNSIELHADLAAAPEGLALRQTLARHGRESSADYRRFKRVAAEAGQPRQRRVRLVQRPRQHLVFHAVHCSLPDVHRSLTAIRTLLVGRDPAIFETGAAAAAAAPGDMSSPSAFRAVPRRVLTGSR